MSHTPYLDLEQEINRLSLAMMTRNRLIGEDLICNLSKEFSLSELSGLVLISLERLLWVDHQALMWAVEHLIPWEVMHEIRELTMLPICKQLIRQGCIPGQDFSVDADGKLLLKTAAQRAIAAPEIPTL